ncbi:uncharacterized protein CEXT_720621 [Caerostris extrusa]|uniref:Uncharacterized protein n=1 Tax=Caerostris extrusa TaxID=172846 RepID=A0AAV4QVG2_CAEEX|nr:uncharacterized protein CEXT_720621 [Caerostris extrusa]
MYNHILCSLNALSAELNLSNVLSKAQQTHRGNNFLENYWDVESFSTKASFLHDDYDGYRIPIAYHPTTKVPNMYSFLNRKALSVNHQGNKLTLDQALTPPSAVDPSVTFHRREDKPTDFHLLEVHKRNNEKKHFAQKFKYDPALMLMGLGKRKHDSNSIDHQNITENQKQKSTF